ncbi:MAG: YceI family protein [Bacteroidales bacterium]|nr:YceI family protein [Bacteroidales bacterium]
MKRLFFITLLLTVLTFTASAQANYSLSNDDLQFAVTGTSSLHEWEMKVTGVSGQMNLTITGEKPNGINNLKVKVKTNTIKSGNGIMDRKTARALKADQYPEIAFKLDTVLSFSSTKSSIKGEVKGILTIAGVNKPVTIPFETESTDNSQLVIKGHTSVLMTDFDIDPPSALAGTLKTGDRVQLIFNTKWVPEEITLNNLSNN